MWKYRMRNHVDTPWEESFYLHDSDQNEDDLNEIEKGNNDVEKGIDAKTNDDTNDGEWD